MGICYEDEVRVAGQRKISGAVLSRMCPNTQYMKHFENSIVLTRLLQVSKCGMERRRANEELGTAEKRMKFWSNRPNFDCARMTEECRKMKELWR